MKKNLLIALVFGALSANAGLIAEEGAAASSQTESKAVALSADEQAFAAKLNDQNRKSFTGKLSIEQRKATMVAVKNGANADEAVQRMLSSREIKEGHIVASSDETENSATDELTEDSNQ